MRILVVEDDPEQRRLLALVLRGRGHTVVEAGSAAEARAAGRCDVSLVDRRLPDGDGLALARALPGRVYLVTGDDKLDPQVEGIDVLVKPVRPADLDALF